MKNKTKYCKKCHGPIEFDAKICPNCGSKVKQDLSLGQIVIYSIVIIIVMCTVLKACTSIREGYDNAAENASISSEADSYSEDEYKNMCRSVTYEELARDKDALKGEKITVSGEVIQVMENTYRISITKVEYGYTDTIVFEIGSDSLEQNILEGDIVTLWGESKGFITYESIVGQQITVPEIRAVYIKNEGRAEN